MRYPFKLPAGILLAGGFILLLFQWMLVGALVRQESFKTVLQEQISHYLETPVKVGFVKAAWPNKITASHLEIKDKALALPFEFRLDRIELRYGMIRTLQRDFAHPQTVIFKDPKFVINEDQTPAIFWRIFKKRLPNRVFMFR